MTLDKFNIQILRALQENAHLTIQELSERVGLSPTPCARRVKQMEEDGIIKRYVALVDGPKIGLGLTAFIHVRLRTQSKKAVDAFEAAIRNMSEIMTCHLVTGNYDYLLMLRVESVDACRKFIRDRLIIIDSVGETETSISLEETKLTTALPLPGPH
ncbi:Lrp/AsnC family transcriptional regulator [Herbaspirillum huttiense]|uniref:Lrp/AsnC family transcriptional regulator n=1 Tax=Herbaspirillum huttiense TaxID=863372 RepID=UPI0039AF550F